MNQEILFYYPDGDAATSDLPPLSTPDIAVIARLLNGKKFWRIALTQIDIPTGVGHSVAEEDFTPQTKGLFVSTIMAYMDFAFGDGPVSLWESLVFYDGKALHSYRTHYHSRLEASTNHTEIVNHLSNVYRAGNALDISNADDE